MARRRRRCCWGTLNTVDPARQRRGRTSSPSAPPSGSTARGVQLWLTVCLAFGVALPGRARLRVRRAQRAAGTATPTARSSGCCSACTRRTSSPTPGTPTVLDVALLHRPARRQALRRRQRERALLVLRRAELAADLRGRLPGAAPLSGDAMLSWPALLLAPLLALGELSLAYSLVTPSCASQDRDRPARGRRGVAARSRSRLTVLAWRAWRDAAASSPPPTRDAGTPRRR